jgi:hypothetical protein
MGSPPAASYSTTFTAKYQLAKKRLPRQQQALFLTLRTCIHSRMMQAGQGIFPPCKVFSRR